MQWKLQLALWQLGALGSNFSDSPKKPKSIYLKSVNLGGNKADGAGGVNTFCPRFMLSFLVFVFSFFT